MISYFIHLNKFKSLLLNMKVINIYLLFICLKNDFAHLFFLLKKAGGCKLIFCGLLRLPAISFQYFTNQKGKGW
jgi:hypothetical protein